MTNVHVGDGKIQKVDGLGAAWFSGATLHLANDDFLLFGNTSGIGIIDVRNASLNAKNALINANTDFMLNRSKGENINANLIVLGLDSSLSNSSANELALSKRNNIDGLVSAKAIDFVKNGILNIAKTGVLKVSDKNALEFSSLRGEGKIFDEKTQAYYDTKNNLLPPDTNIVLSTLQNGYSDAAYSFDGTKLVLNKGFEFSLSGDKPAFIVNNGVILKAHITGTELRHISGSGVIKELHLSNAADFGLSSQAQKILIDFGSVLHVYKQVDFKNISGEGLVNINGRFYDTDGQALNANNSVKVNIKKYDFAIAKAAEKAKDKKDAYINVDESQNSDVDLLNIEMANNDNLL